MKVTCGMCGTTREIEAPEHCGGKCELVGFKFVCPKCGYSEEMPECCGAPMKKVEE